MQGYCDVYKWTTLKRTSPEVKCLHPTSSKREMCTSSVSTVIYHKFSYGAAFHTLSGKNVNVMLEFYISLNILGVLTLKAPITTAAHDIHKYFFIVFQKKIRLDVSSESSAKQWIHMKNQALFSLKDRRKKL